MQNYRATYSQMRDDELSALGRQFDTLVEEAKAALREEFEARGRDLEAELKAAEAQEPALVKQAPAPQKRARKANKRRFSWNWRLSWNWVSVSFLAGAVFWMYGEWSSMSRLLALAAWIVAIIAAVELFYRRLERRSGVVTATPSEAPEPQDVMRRVERLESENRRLKLGVLALAIILAAYVFTHWNPPDRYRAVDVTKWEGTVALDDATGHLCKTLPYQAAPQDSPNIKFMASLPVCGK